MVLVFENIFYLLSGFTLLVLSGDKLVETSIKIAKKWNVPTSVIAVTIIAAGTSAPELFTSFLAGYKGNSDISIGNVLGSNVFNILAVGGISLMIQPGGNIKGTKISWIVLFFATALLYYTFLDLQLSQLEAILYIVALNAFLFLSFFRERENENSFENLEDNHFGRTLLFFGASFVGLIFGADLALEGGVGLGKLAGLSERVIAVTIISAGTGLPELATSVAAAFRGHSEVAIANIIGSNIFNSLGIPGATALFFTLNVDDQFLNFDFHVMAAATMALLLIYAIKNPNIMRMLGFFMFLSYSAYALKLLFL